MNFQFFYCCDFEKNRSRSPKSNQLFVISQLCIRENLVRIQSLVQKILCRKKKCLRIFSFSTAVTLKIRSRSPKSNLFFVMSQLYMHVNLVRIQPLVHKILYRQESVTPMPMGFAPKSMTPSPLVGGHKYFITSEKSVF